ncbi:hypothetical protein CTI14_25740, partial [Methylobacterium radiotolerans]
DSALSAVMDQIPKILVSMQDELSVPPQGRIGSMPVTTQKVPTIDSKSRIQLLVLSAVGGIALTLLADRGLRRIDRGLGFEDSSPSRSSQEESSA